MDEKKVRIELYEDQVDLLLKLLEQNEPPEEDVKLMDAWYFSKLKLTKALNRFK